MTRGSSQLWERQQWGREFWRRREISRLKGIGFSERHRWYRFPNTGFFPSFSRIPFPPSIEGSHRGNDPAFISPSGPGYFVTPARVDAFVSLPLVPLPPSASNVARFLSRYSTKLFDKRDVERDQLSPSLPPPFPTTIPCLRSRYSTSSTRNKHGQFR